MGEHMEPYFFSAGNEQVVYCWDKHLNCVASIWANRGVVRCSFLVHLDIYVEAINAHVTHSTMLLNNTQTYLYSYNKRAMPHVSKAETSVK